MQIKNNLSKDQYNIIVMQLKRTIKDWEGQTKEVIATFVDGTSMSKQLQKKRFKWETWGIKGDLKKTIHVQPVSIQQI